jgi:hypothetical protein
LELVLLLVEYPLDHLGQVEEVQLGLAVAVWGRCPEALFLAQYQPLVGWW